jgi:poly(3-hydroxyalkanoate) synthetase
MKESLMYSEYLKEINLKENKFVDEDWSILNEILKVSKIERIKLAGK